MSDNNITNEFLQKLAPCIERGELERCVEEAARLAGEMGIGAGALLNLSTESGDDGKHDFAYVLALAAAQGLERKEKAVAYNSAGIKAENINKMDMAEKHYVRAVEADPNYAEAQYNYANLLVEIGKNNEAEQYYKKAIELDTNDPDAHNNYALLLIELDKKAEAEEQYKKAIEIDPKYVRAHINYARLLVDLNRKTEAEEYYKKIVFNPKYADVNTNNNYGILLGDLGKKTEAEEQYKKAIELYPKCAEVHFNYAILLEDLDRINEAEEHYKKAIEQNPKYLKALNNYAMLLERLKRKIEAEEHYQKAIEIDPKYANAHGNYGLLLIDLDKREHAWKETELASNLFKKSGRVTDSYLAKAWFYQRSADKNLERNRYKESSEDINKAGGEYLCASETVEGEIKYAFELKGNVCKAQSFIRKEHKTNQELVNDLKNASEFYKKASVCPAGGTEETCGACYNVMDVFSQALTALEGVVHNKKPSIRKEEWNEKLEKSNDVYIKKSSKKGAALVAALKPLIKCVDELAYYTARKSSLQKKRLKECYKTLEDVSSKVEGGLRNITDPANEVIKKYSKEMGISMPEEKASDETPSHFNWLIKVTIGAFVTIILGYITNQLFEWKVHVSIWNYLKSFFS